MGINSATALLFTGSNLFLGARLDTIVGLFWAVLTGWSVRLILVASVYKGFLDPAQDYWEFGYKIGRVAGPLSWEEDFPILPGLTLGLLLCSHRSWP
jgi:hypothetical protein